MRIAGLWVLVGVGVGVGVGGCWGPAPVPLPATGSAEEDADEPEVKIAFPLVRPLDGSLLVTPVQVGSDWYLFELDPLAPTTRIDGDVVAHGSDDETAHVRLVAGDVVHEVDAELFDVRSIPRAGFDLMGVLGGDILRDDLELGVDRDAGIATLATPHVFAPPAAILATRGARPLTAAARIARWGPTPCEHLGCVEVSIGSDARLDVRRDPSASAIPLEVTLVAVGLPAAPRLRVGLPADAPAAHVAIDPRYAGHALVVADMSPFPDPCTAGSGADCAYVVEVAR